MISLILFTYDIHFSYVTKKLLISFFKVSCYTENQLCNQTFYTMQTLRREQCCHSLSSSHQHGTLISETLNKVSVSTTFAPKYETWRNIFRYCTMSLSKLFYPCQLAYSSSMTMTMQLSVSRDPPYCRLNVRLYIIPRPNPAISRKNVKTKIFMEEAVIHLCF